MVIPTGTSWLATRLTSVALLYRNKTTTPFAQSQTLALQQSGKIATKNWRRINQRQSVSKRTGYSLVGVSRALDPEWRV